MTRQAPATFSPPPEAVSALRKSADAYLAGRLRGLPPQFGDHDRITEAACAQAEMVDSLMGLVLGIEPDSLERHLLIATLRNHWSDSTGDVDELAVRIVEAEADERAVA